MVCVDYSIEVRVPWSIPRYPIKVRMRKIDEEGRGVRFITPYSLLTNWVTELCPAPGHYRRLRAPRVRQILSQIYQPQHAYHLDRYKHGRECGREWRQHSRRLIGETVGAPWREERMNSASLSYLVPLSLAGGRIDLVAT